MKRGLQGLDGSIILGHSLLGGEALRLLVGGTLVALYNSIGEGHGVMEKLSGPRLLGF